MPRGSIRIGYCLSLSGPVLRKYSKRGARDDLDESWSFSAIQEVSWRGTYLYVGGRLEMFHARMCTNA